jgi:hypothetical protein
VDKILVKYFSDFTNELGFELDLLTPDYLKPFKNKYNAVKTILQEGIYNTPQERKFTSEHIQVNKK